MEQLVKRPPLGLMLALPAALLSTLIVVLNRIELPNHPALGMAITVDLVLVIPLVYWLVIRNRQIPNTTVVPVILLGTYVGTMFLPEQHQEPLALFKTWALPVLELGLISFVVFKFLKARRAFKNTKGGELDFFTALKDACREVLPAGAVLPFATEIAVFYYGFLNWKKRPLGPGEFTYHKNSGALALFGALIMVVLIETVGLHFILAKWSQTLAWVMTLLSAYTALQLFGIARSVPQRPIQITAHGLQLRYGFVNEVWIDFAQIKHIRKDVKELAKDKGTKALSPLGALDPHNVVLELKAPAQLTGIYGIKRTFTTLTFTVDQVDAFVKQTQEHLEEIV